VLLSGDGNPGQAFEFEGTGFGVLTGITAGAATAFSAFVGFEDSVNMAEEVRDPIRSFPPALLTGIVGASIIYLLVGFTAAMTVPLDTLTESSGPLLEVVKEGVPGLNADTVFSAVAMIAVSNTMLINMLMASRLLYGMANQGVLPAPFGPVSARKTPWFGIAFTTALSILLILTTDDLEGLSDTTVLLLTSVFLLVNIAVLVLRRDRVGHQHFTARGPCPSWARPSAWCSCCPSTGRPRSTARPSSCCWAASPSGRSTSSSPGAPAPWSPSRT